jgi:hypothetical protein
LVSNWQEYDFPKEKETMYWRHYIITNTRSKVATDAISDLDFFKHMPLPTEPLADVENAPLMDVLTEDAK